MTRPIDALRPSAAQLPESGIVKVFNHGRYKQGLIPLWAGEGDLPTPAFIAAAAAASLKAGDTFYTANRGIPALREALARYHSKLYGGSYAPDEFFVVGGGMQAIQIACQMITGPSTEVVVPTPAWPNFRGALEINGARAVSVPMTFGATGWRLDLDAVFRACGPYTRAIVVNSPSNPTGWTASRDELQAILEFTRAKGLWIIADEIYTRFHYAGGTAPTLQHLKRPDDRILFAQTFSKNWAMTGWRIGWLQAPAELGAVIETHVQYNTSGVATFMQKAAVAALEDGEPFVASMIARAAEGRRIVSEALAPVNSVRYVPPPGAFYAFFGLEGMTDSMAAALELVDAANIGLAPGTAFGDGGDEFFRVCFLRAPDQVAEAMRRLAAWLEQR